MDREPLIVSLYPFQSSRWTGARAIAAVAAGVLLLPFVLLALVPMLIMFVPVAVIGIPVIAPVMLSGVIAARWEDRQRVSRPAPSPALKRPTLVAR
jgi:sugar phosphate permease